MAGGQHGIDVLGMNDFLIFNNNSAGGMNPAGGGGAGTGNGSVAIEIKVDPSTKKATKAWSYKSSAAIQVDIMGDLQRLPNGDTVVGYSTKGELQEMTAAAPFCRTSNGRPGRRSGTSKSGRHFTANRYVEPTVRGLNEHHVSSFRVRLVAALRPACGSSNSSGGGGAAPTCTNGSITAAEANDYAFSSTITLPSVTVRLMANLTVDWSGVTHDFLGHALTRRPTWVLASSCCWKEPLAEFQTNLNADNLLASDLIVSPPPSIAPTGGKTSAMLYDFTINGTPVSSSDFNTYFDPSKYPPASNTSGRDPDRDEPGHRHPDAAGLPARHRVVEHHGDVDQLVDEAAVLGEPAQSAGDRSPGQYTGLTLDWGR